MNIKIRPVRWWRDDATRYLPRPRYSAPPAPRFDIELIPTPIDPELARCLDAMKARVISAMLNPWAPPSQIDPLDDIRQAMSGAKRAIEMDARERGRHGRT